MVPRYLIDGYNLIHAMGLLPARLGDRTLEQSRERLLAHLRAAFGDDANQLEVVFDARRASRRSCPVQHCGGITVRFAVGATDADELIREIVAADPLARNLRVVSNDHAVRDAVKRRGAVPLSCDAFLDIAERHRLTKSTKETSADADAKPQPRPSDVDYWLKTFGDGDAHE